MCLGCVPACTLQKDGRTIRDRQGQGSVSRDLFLMLELLSNIPSQVGHSRAQEDCSSSSFDRGSWRRQS